MKKLYVVLAILAIIATACQMGGAPQQVEPTPVPLVATPFPSPTPAPLNPTAESPSGPPQAGTERASSVDGMTQVYVPEGTFMRGGLDANTESNELPAVKITMKGFWMDKVEVTNGMYLLCFQAGVCDLPRYGNLTLSKSETRENYFRNPEFNDYPVVYVTWGAADTYCKWAGRRLPTEAEWEYSARGAFPSLNTFPWGDQQPDGSYANFNYYVGDTTRVGSFPAGVSPFGILDLAGNVAEWVNDFYDANYYSQGISMNPSGPIARSNIFLRVVRGGSFGDAWQNIRVSKRASMMGPDPSQPVGSDKYYGSSASTVGFRCASDN